MIDPMGWDAHLDGPRPDEAGERLSKLEKEHSDALASAEVVLTRSMCPHAMAHVLDVDCGCEPREVTAFVAGEVFVTADGDLDAEVLAAALDGEQVTLSAADEVKAEDALIQAWREQHQKVAS